MNAIVWYVAESRISQMNEETKPPTYPSLDPTLTLFSQIGQNVGSRKGKVGSLPRILHREQTYKPSKLIFPFFLVSAWLTSRSISFLVSLSGILFKRHRSSSASIMPSPDSSQILNCSRTSCWVSCAIFLCINMQNSLKSTAPLPLKTWKNL